jgi:hypothetical protein
LSDRAISELSRALDDSPLEKTLFALTGLQNAGVYNFQRRGRPNTSGTATLTWQIASGEIPPFEVTVRVEAPGQYGHSHIQSLDITVEIISKLSAWMRTPDSPQPPPPGDRRHLEVAEWGALLDAVLGTLTEPRVVAAVADVADVDPIVVPPPMAMTAPIGPTMTA